MNCNDDHDDYDDHSINLADGEHLTNASVFGIEGRKDDFELLISTGDGSEHSLTIGRAALTRLHADLEGYLPELAINAAL